MAVTITISDRMAAELQDWCECERERWPADTAYQRDLLHVLTQLDFDLPTAEDVRGVLSESGEQG